MNKYITVLITDTHFGTHNSSMTWLKSQKEFFDKQLIPHLKKRKKEGYRVRLIHCGDVFDSRSTINTYIATAVVDLFSQICEIVDRFYIVGGNHDYYSPEVDDVDTIGLIFNQLRLKHLGTFFPITQTKFSDTWCEDGKDVDLFVPWYEWIKHDDLVEYLENFRADCEPGVDITHIFTHADLVREKTDIECPNIISGHIHTPYFKDNIKNLGSVFELTFTDNNAERGFYEYEEGGELKFIENTKSIRFWRFYNDEVLEIPKNVKKEDYIEIYINRSKIAQKKYADAYAAWVKKFKNIWRVPQIDDEDQTVPDIKKFEGYNIETMTEGLIPEELKDKFNQIKQYINTTKD
jgi:DNA repair exonuclease SbcCD nuclease subunit